MKNISDNQNINNETQKLILFFILAFSALFRTFVYVNKIISEVFPFDLVGCLFAWYNDRFGFVCALCIRIGCIFWFRHFR